MPMKKLKIKRGDTVVVIAGKDKGKEGKVLKVLPKKDKVVVEGVNKVKKHIKKGALGKQGEIVEKEMPIHISNVQIKDPKTGKPSRIRFEIKGDKKVRIAVKSGAEIK